ncbi:MAG TPA: lysine--tRNA ligase [bacterium]|jgi:lysyl-tRNA synthetase class 1|nr:lysine--tRNA ligase [bacterium]
MWADLLVQEIMKTRPGSHVVNDAWSPSGDAHIGSLKGVVLHDAITRGLREQGVDVRFSYGFDDYDPFDAVPPYLDAARFSPFLGKPLADVPAPEPGAESFGQFYGLRFVEEFRRLDCRPEVYWGSALYRGGRMNEAIRRVLDRAEQILEIDREISGSQRAERHPLQIICESCGKIATTVIAGWDGREVLYECRPGKVAWAQGCGHVGRRSPFDGAAKLIYRVEWAAKWWVLGVTVEGAGKDHFTRGGSHDTAAAVAERVFEYPTPFPIPYEFLLIGGAKMSGSAGKGVLARDLQGILRPELTRFLMIRPHYREQKNFDPSGETIPRLYDEYDRAVRAFRGEVDDPELARTFFHARIGGAPVEAYLPRFGKIATLAQIPSVDLEAAVAEEKGAPLTEADRRELAARVADARRWLDGYAPEAYKIEVQAGLPPAAATLSAPQQRFLGALADALEGAPWRGEALHALIHEVKNGAGLPPQQAFGALYRAFLGRDSGPQAGWLLAALDRRFVLERLRAAAGERTAP